MIQCTLVYNSNKVTELLCSNILEDDYKQLLKIQTPKNVAFWLQKGLRKVPEIVTGRYDQVVLHVPTIEIPLTETDRGKTEGLLKKLASIMDSSPVVNYA